MTTTEIAVITPQPVTEAQSSAWLSMANAKNQLTASLATMELQAQAILLPVKSSEDHAVIDEATAAYRKLHTQIVETRKPFTNAIDSGIIQPLMAFEKRVDPKTNADYIELLNKSLTLRKIEEKKAELANAKNDEIARFKAHVQNEFFRVAHEYRSTLAREVAKTYADHLNAKTKPDFEALKKVFKEIAIPAVAKFNASLLQGPEMLEIYSAIPKPDYLTIYNAAMQDLDNVFSNFDSDIANAAAAIQHQQEQMRLAQIEEDKKLSEEVAINTLIASSETVVIDTPKIKKTLQVTIVESEQWAKSVMSAFIVNLPRMAKYFRVKSWSKLSIGQMAAYLGQLATDEGVVFNNLQMQEVLK